MSAKNDGVWLAAGWLLSLSCAAQGLHLESLQPSQGYVLDGPEDNALVGESVAVAGDVNGDGLDDYLMTTRGFEIAGLSTNGGAFLIFGSEAGLISPYDLSQADGIDSVALARTSPQGSSNSMNVAGVGDLNGDGRDDFAVAFSDGDIAMGRDRGVVFIVFGVQGDLPNPIDLTALDGTDGFAVVGAADNDVTGFALASAGDFDADGVEDVLIGALGAGTGERDRAGAAYVLFGRSDPWPAVVDLSAINGLNGIVARGVGGEDELSASLDGLGDVNGDDIPDLIIGSRRDIDETRGAAYVIFGSDSRLPSPFDLESLDGDNGFRIAGEPFDRAATTVAGIGDFNQDGLNDILVSARSRIVNGDDIQGRAYVIFGADDGFPAVFNVGNINGINGIELSYPDRFFSLHASAGDHDGDGVPDLGLLATLEAGAQAPVNILELVIVFGGRQPYPSPFNLAGLDGNQGRSVSWSGDFASQVRWSRAGDTNGDGNDDLILSRHRLDTNGTDSGRGYLIYGNKADALFADGFGG